MTFPPPLEGFDIIMRMYIPETILLPIGREIFSEIMHDIKMKTLRCRLELPKSQRKIHGKELAESTYTISLTKMS
jgi:hypothetical protein